MAQNIDGILLPTNYVWDIARLQEASISSPEFKELLVRLYRNVGDIALSCNAKSAGYYNTLEYMCGNYYFPLANAQTTEFRPTYRKVIHYTTALPNANFVPIPHGLPVTTSWRMVNIYGCTNDPVALQYLPLPYASPTLANNIELSVVGANIVITTGSNRNAFTDTTIVLEYLKF